MCTIRIPILILSCWTTRIPILMFSCWIYALYEGTGAHSAQMIMGMVERYYLVRDIDSILVVVLLELNQCVVVPVILLSNVFMLSCHLHFLYTMRGIMLTRLVLSAMDYLPLVQVPRKFHIYALTGCPGSLEENILRYCGSNAKVNQLDSQYVHKLGIILLMSWIWMINLASACGSNTIGNLCFFIKLLQNQILSS